MGEKKEMGLVLFRQNNMRLFVKKREKSTEMGKRKNRERELLLIGEIVHKKERGF